MNSTEAKRGFLTFLATLTFSIGVFFATYIGITTLNDKSDIGKADSDLSSGSGQVRGSSNVASEDKSDKQGSVFASLVNTDSVTINEVKVVDSVSAPVVLAASTGGQSTSGATPATGFNDIFYVTIMGASLILFGLYFGTSKARAFAIRKFENDASK